MTRRYRPGRSVCFFATKPKLREVFAADFRDRVVHHLLVEYLERIWEPIFIHDSYACRKGKGVHAAVERLQGFLRQATANGTRPAWFLQLDVRNYFMRIDKDILFRMLERKLRDETARWLTRTLVYHDCTEDFVMRGNPALIKAVPPHKTLFGAQAGKGCGRPFRPDSSCNTSGRSRDTAAGPPGCTRHTRSTCGAVDGH